MIRIAAALAAASSLAAAPVIAKSTPRPVVIGYLPTFRDYRPTLATVDMSKLTHINIAFVNPDPAGNIVNGETMACVDGYNGGMLPADDIRDIVAAAHKHGVKVLASLGGGAIPACSGDWTQLLAPETRPVVVANLVRFADDFKLDGIDIDLEWKVLTEIDNAGEYVPFAAELGAALHARGKLLTCATASNEGGMVPIGSLPVFDYVNIMSYDGVGPDWGNPGDEHATLEMARHDIAVWQARGVPKERLVLGVPFYGHGFGDYAHGNNYKDILEKFGDMASLYDVQGQRCAGCSYVTYNGRPTLRAKARLAAEQTAGVMIWELTEDAPAPNSLLDAVYDSLHNP
ncbi:MAG: glycosyl hydrolase family 18 [Asticcacaulis sp.]|nr:glycosyl hydrolase family 18 [Asticcacaulis sp.]